MCLRKIGWGHGLGSCARRPGPTCDVEDEGDEHEREGAVERGTCRAEGKRVADARDEPRVERGARDGDGEADRAEDRADRRVYTRVPGGTARSERLAVALGGACSVGGAHVTRNAFHWPGASGERPDALENVPQASATVNPALMLLTTPYVKNASTPSVFSFSLSNLACARHACEEEDGGGVDGAMHPFLDPRLRSGDRSRLVVLLRPRSRAHRRIAAAEHMADARVSALMGDGRAAR